MAQDKAQAADSVTVEPSADEAAVLQANAARRDSITNDVKAARQRVTDAEKALKAIEKEANK